MAEAPFDEENAGVQGISRRVIALIIVAVVVIASIGFVLLGNTGDDDGGPDVVDDRPMADWDVVMFLDGDNNLESEEALTVKLMSRVGSVPGKLNILALVDLAGANDSYAVYINRGETETNVTQIALSDIDANWTDEVDMGSPETIISFMNYTWANYPARHFNLVFNDHGGGWYGMMWDDTSGNNLDLADCTRMFSTIAGIIGHPVDVMSTDTCLIQMVEFGYALRGGVDYMVSATTYQTGAMENADGTITLGNWDYERVWGALRDNTNMTPRELSILMVDYYIDIGPYPVPKVYSSDCLSAMDINQMDNLSAACDALATAVQGAFPVHRAQLTVSMLSSESYSGQFDWLGQGSYTNYDLGDLADCILSFFFRDEYIIDACQELIAAVNQAIIANHYGSGAITGEHPGSTGIAIYFPQRSNEWDPDYLETAFAHDTQWDELIQAYYRLTP